MDLTVSEDQILFRQSVAAVLAGDAAGGPSDRWNEFSDLGWLSLPLPEDAGGLGLGLVETGIVLEGFGRAALRTPYLSTAILAAGLIARLAPSPQREGYLSRIGAGRLRIAFAHEDRRATERTHATRTAEGWVLNGHKVHIIDIGNADALLISAVTNSCEGGLALFLLPIDAPGLTLRGSPCIDGESIGEVDLAGVSAAPALCFGGDAATADMIEAIVDRALIASCFELVGIMDSLFELTRDYTATRSQFGKPIAANQVIRHRLVDMAVSCEEARAITMRAAIIADEDDSRATMMAASAAKAKVAPAAKLLAEEAVQLHGAMGVTEEVSVGRRLKRVLALHPQYGSPAYHLHRHMRLRRLQSA